MKRRIIVVAGAVLAALWGAAHLLPTATVVDGFGAIGADNRNIIAMEWINEGLTLLFLGALTILVVVSDQEGGRVARRVYVATAAMLLAMAVLSLFTGFEVDFLPFKLCPAIFTVSAVMIGQGAFVRRWAQPVAGGPAREPPP